MIGGIHVSHSAPVDVFVRRCDETPVPGSSALFHVYKDKDSKQRSFLGSEPTSEGV